jgi:hypothetical protein
MTKYGLGLTGKPAGVAVPHVTWFMRIRTKNGYAKGYTEDWKFAAGKISDGREVI